MRINEKKFPFLRTDLVGGKNYYITKKMEDHIMGIKGSINLIGYLDFSKRMNLFLSNGIVLSLQNRGCNTRIIDDKIVEKLYKAPWFVLVLDSFFHGAIVFNEISNGKCSYTPYINTEVPLPEDTRWQNMEAASVLFLKILIFIQLTDIKEVYVEKNKKRLIHKERVLNETKHSVIVVDSLWDLNLHSNSPFFVKGHYRKQPYGIGRSKMKLIWIDGFTKKGYHRRAGKTIHQ